MTVPSIPTSTNKASGADILDCVERFCGRFIAYPSNHARIAHALWIAHAHKMEAWDTTPRLAFLSPEPASGKTRALEISALLVPRPVEAVNVSSAYLFRKVSDEDGLPTLLFDEIDTVFGPKAGEHEDLRGLLNAGNRRGAATGRCVMHGNIAVTEDFPAYCAVAIAGLGGLPDTILSRSVIVRMQPRTTAERVEPYRRRIHSAEGHALRDDLAAWLAVTDLTWPELPLGIEDRDADVWESLLAVAEAAGGRWPELARRAASALVAEGQSNTPSLGVRLLADIRTILADVESVHSKTLIAALNSMDEAPWATMRRGPLNARWLGDMLKKYGVSSAQIRIGSENLKGYYRSDFLDAWTRYLPLSSHNAETGETSETGAGFESESALDDVSLVLEEAKQGPRNETEFRFDVSPVSDVSQFLRDGEKEPDPPCFVCDDPADSYNEQGSRPAACTWTTREERYEPGRPPRTAPGRRHQTGGKNPTAPDLYRSMRRHDSRSPRRRAREQASAPRCPRRRGSIRRRSARPPRPRPGPGRRAQLPETSHLKRRDGRRRPRQLDEVHEARQR